MLTRTEMELELKRRGPARCGSCSKLEDDCTTRVTDCGDFFDCGFVEDGCGGFLYCGPKERLYFPGAQNNYGGALPGAPGMSPAAAFMQSGVALSPAPAPAPMSANMNIFAAPAPAPVAGPDILSLGPAGIASFALDRVFPDPARNLTVEDKIQPLSMQHKLNQFVRQQCVSQNPVTLKPFQCQANKCVCVPK